VVKQELFGGWFCEYVIGVCNKLSIAKKLLFNAIQQRMENISVESPDSDDSEEDSEDNKNIVDMKDFKVNECMEYAKCIWRIEKHHIDV
jgi:hypothetical protein